MTDGNGTRSLYIPSRKTHALVDADLYDELARFRWHISAGYVARAPRKGEPRRAVLLHRAIIGRPPFGKIVDHINRDKMDCRRENLRFVTLAENARNSKQRLAYDNPLLLEAARLRDEAFAVERRAVDEALDSTGGDLDAAAERLRKDRRWVAQRIEVAGRWHHLRSSLARHYWDRIWQDKP